MKQKLENEKVEIKKNVNGYLKYSGIGFQIVGIMGVGMLIGYQVDKWIHTPQPYFMTLFAIAFLVLGLYVSLRDFIKEK